MRIAVIMSCLALTNSIVCARQPRSDYDVVIYGATPAGIAAAIAAARENCTVVLLAPYSYIGGIMSNGLCGTDIDNHKGFINHTAVGGLALEFYRRSAKMYGWLDSLDYVIENNLKKPKFWRYEPHIATAVFEQWLKEYKRISIIRAFKLDRNGNGVIKKKGRIQSIKSTTGIVIKGRIFIDATLEGDLLVASGVSTIIGRESNLRYGEDRNGIRPLTEKDQFKIQFDPYVICGDPSSGLLPGIDLVTSLAVGRADKRTQAYCYRICLTRNPSDQKDIPRPDHYNRDDYAIYLRYLKNGGKLAVPSSNIPNEKIDFNGGGDLSHNLYCGHYIYLTGDYMQRDSIKNAYQEYTMGLLYYYSNDTAVGRIAPKFQSEWKKLGLAKDEFMDNHNWPRTFYVRDSRRMVSDYVITEHQIKRIGAAPVADPVAVAFWPPDLHAVRRVLYKGKIYNEGTVFGGHWWKPFGISYRSMVPKKNEVINLLTPTCISSSHIAYGAIRIEWTFMALGQAAGIAASIACQSDIPVQDVPYAKLSGKLLKCGAVLHLRNQINKSDVKN